MAYSVPNIGWSCASNVCNRTAQQLYVEDKRVSLCAKRYGEMGFSFISYPLGGVQRHLWHSNENGGEPPNIHLPDLQLKNEFWAKYVNCPLSRWIDPDSTEGVKQLSSIHLEREIDYAKYLGIRNVIVELKHRESPKLAQILKRHLEMDQQLEFWILLPMNADKFGQSDDVWSIWRSFRTQCGNSEKIFVALKFCEDLSEEFVSEVTVGRWYAEPLAAVYIDYNIFSFDANSALGLTKIHSRLFNKLIVSQKQHVVLGSFDTLLDDAAAQQMVQCIQRLFLANQETFRREKSVANYLDVLQTPLQPLSDNLDSTVYQTFEQDRPKYAHYQQAIAEALKDLASRGFSQLVLFVLGAGRGPLVEASLNAKKELLDQVGNQFSLELVAVEKNRNAFLSLQYCNEERWSDLVQLVQADMRSLSGMIETGILKRPDLIVSELLGSFGDNELSPECLDGVTHILQPHTVSIPHSYVNFIAPIQSLPLHQSIMAIEKRNKSEQCVSEFHGRTNEMHSLKATDRIYVVCMDQFCFLSEEVKPCFEFVHPNRERKSNCRSASLEFTLRPKCELMGLAGYFDVCLYKDIYLSTHPQRHTPELYSWFFCVCHILFITTEYYCIRETKMVFHIERKVDDGGCWYEWSIEYQEQGGVSSRSELQNPNAESEYMKLH